MFASSRVGKSVQNYTCSQVFATVFGCSTAKRALYGMKSYGRDFRNHLRDYMDHMGYKSCLADPDLWMRSYFESTWKTFPYET